jgi:Flp pilus assembly protein CpaB
MTYRIRNVVVAVGLALVAMLLTLLYVTNVRRSTQRSAGTVQVYVAARDVAGDTPGSQIVAQHELRLEQVQRSAVVPGAISSPGQISDLLLAGPLYEGEQVTLRRFTNAAAQGIRAQLHGTMRAIEIGGDPNQLLVGTLQTGDRVDVVANVRPNANSTAAATRIVLRDLPVLSAPTTTGASKLASPGAASSVILGVTDAQVQRLFFVVKNGDWSLELRPVVGALDSRDRVETANSILTEGMR